LETEEKSVSPPQTEKGMQGQKHDLPPGGKDQREGSKNPNDEGRETKWRESGLWGRGVGMGQSPLIGIKLSVTVGKIRQRTGI